MCVRLIVRATLELAEKAELAVVVSAAPAAAVATEPPTVAALAPLSAEVGLAGDGWGTRPTCACVYVCVCVCSFLTFGLRHCCRHKPSWPSDNWIWVLLSGGIVPERHAVWSVRT